MVLCKPTAVGKANSHRAYARAGMNSVRAVPWLLRWICCCALLCLTATAPVSAEQARTAAQPRSIARRVALGDLPLNLLLVPDGYIVSTNSGYARQYLQAFDERRGIITDKLELPSLWYGLAYDPVEQVLLASSVTDTVYVVPFSHGRFGRARAVAIEGCRLTAGIAIQASPVALVACNQSHSLVQFNYRSETILRHAATGEFPFAVLVLPRERVAVSNWGSASVSLLDGSTLETVATLSVGSHPNQMLLIPQTENLLVACSDADLLSVLDLHELRETRKVGVRASPGELPGAQPNGLAYDTKKQKLYVALANLRAVAVFDVEKDGDLEFKGRLPVGPYPTALALVPASGNLYIANGRNDRTGPNTPLLPSGSYPRIGSLLGGGLSVISSQQLLEQSKQALSHRPVGQATPKTFGARKCPCAA